MKLNVVELEERCNTKLSNGIWRVYKSDTCARETRGEVGYSYKEWYQLKYPSVEIITYKAEVEKMKFNKESVITKIDEWADEKETSLNELKASIRRMEEDEKVVVPKFVAEWIESEKGYNIWRMIENLRNGNSLEKSVINWLEEKYPKYGLRDLFDLLALMRIKGYTIAPEPLYVIPLENLVTSDGVQQYLSYDATGQNYFASRPQYDLKQKYTKDELSNVPECYKIFAKPLEENQ